VGVYSNITTEIYTRLNRDKTALGLKAIQLGDTKMNLQQGMTPFIQILPDSGFISEDYGGSSLANRKEGTINLALYCTNPIVDRTGVDTMTATIEFVEKVLDTINTGATGDVSPQVNQSYSMACSVDEFVKHESTVEFTIRLSIKLKPFVINGRN